MKLATIDQEENPITFLERLKEALVKYTPLDLHLLKSNLF